jgi:hypothetical protein
MIRTAVAAVMVAVNLAVAPFHPATAPPKALLVYDGFNGTQLNTNLWSTMAHYVPGEDSTYVASQVSVRNGALQLTAQEENGKWVTGEVISKWAYTYGTFSFRAKIEGWSQGAWPAIYLEGYGPWPACGEIDILESTYHLNHGRENVMTIHAGTAANPAVQWQTAKFAPINFSVWNTFSLIKTPNSITYVIDGRQVATDLRSQTPRGDVWAFNNHVYSAMFGLPMGGYGQNPNSTTAKSITMLVDWYEVTSP